MMIYNNYRNQLLYSFIAAISLFVFSKANAQITIDSTDMPFPGDVIHISTGLNIDFIDHTETGENFTWDFSELIPIYQTTDTFVSPSQTPFTYQFFFMGRTNLAYRYIQDLPIPDFELSNVFYYYKNSQSRFENAGYAASLNVLPLPFVLSSPDILYRFPLQYGDQDSSVSGLIYNLPDLAYFEIDRKRINKVDGWGTLVTPFGSFEVLRMTSEVIEYDSIYIDSLEMGIPVNRHYTEYKWLAKGQKIPVLNITSDTEGLLVTYTDSVRLEYEYINGGNIQNKSFKVYPNPASTEILVEFNIVKPGIGDIAIIDMTGKYWFKNAAESFVHGVNRKKISLEDVPEGNYIVVIRMNSNVLARKIVINK